MSNLSQRHWVFVTKDMKHVLQNQAKNTDMTTTIFLYHFDKIRQPFKLTHIALLFQKHFAILGQLLLGQTEILPGDLKAQKKRKMMSMMWKCV